MDHIRGGRRVVVTGGGGWGIISRSTAAAIIPSTAQKVEADADDKGERAPMEVLKFEEVRISAMTVYSRVRWRYNRVMVDYI